MASGSHVDEIGDQRSRQPVVGERGAERGRGLGDGAAAIPLKRWVTRRAPASIAAAVCARSRSSGRARRRSLGRRAPRSPRRAPSASGPSVMSVTTSGSDVDPGEVGGDDELAAMGAGRTAEERPFEVGSGDAWARAPERAAARCDRRQSGRVGSQRGGDERRAPRRRALRGEQRVEALPVGAARVRDVDVVDAVDLESTKPAVRTRSGTGPGRRQRRRRSGPSCRRRRRHRGEDAASG